MNARTLPLPASTPPAPAVPVVRIEPFAVELATAGEILGNVSVSTIKRLVRSGDLQTVKILGATRIAVDELRRFIQRQAQK